MARNLYQEVGVKEQDNLFNDIKIPLVEKFVKFKKSNTPILRGTVLGVITATGFAVPVDSTKTDGSQVAKYVLAMDVDASASDVEAVGYASGQFNRKALIFGGSDTADKHEDALRALGIFMKDNL